MLWATKPVEPNDMTDSPNRLERHFLLILLVAALAAIGWIIWPFIPALLVAALLASLLAEQEVYDRCRDSTR